MPPFIKAFHAICSLQHDRGELGALSYYFIDCLGKFNTFKTHEASCGIEYVYFPDGPNLDFADEIKSPQQLTLAKTLVQAHKMVELCTTADRLHGLPASVKSFKDLNENMPESLKDLFSGNKDTLTYNFDQAVNTFAKELAAKKVEEDFQRNERFRNL